MDESRLQSLYRRLGATRREALSADELVEALSRAGYPDEEGTVLDRLAASTAEADLLRTALQLSAESSTLSRDVTALRLSQRPRTPARRWLALAAGVGAAALLVASLREAPHQPPVTLPATAATSDAILTVSFEGAPSEASSLDEAQPIFRSDFDS